MQSHFGAHKCPVTDEILGRIPVEEKFEPSFILMLSTDKDVLKKKQNNISYNVF